MWKSDAARIGVLTAAIAAAFPALAAEDAETNRLIQRLMERVEKLEKRNAELEKGLQSLEDRNARLDTLTSEEVSEKEPELASRLKAVEYQALDMQKKAKAIDSIEGFSAGANFTSVAQRASGIDSGGTQVNYRADITVTTPTIHTGDIESKLFGHFRVGQGKGLSDKFTSFVGPNATSFQLGSVVAPESSAMMLAQAWYQADIPLPFGGFKPHSRETLTVNFGKMDPFAFFDQNAAANDETRQFLASTFVHNALLDNPLAANIGADGFGFSPGVRVSYFNWRAKPESYRLSLGVFGAGRSANFSDSFKSPFVILQAETSQRFLASRATTASTSGATGRRRPSSRSKPLPTAVSDSISTSASATASRCSGAWARPVANACPSIAPPVLAPSSTAAIGTGAPMPSGLPSAAIAPARISAPSPRCSTRTPTACPTTASPPRAGNRSWRPITVFAFMSGSN
jgi:hypothetical protein